jgi:hypothetical protein
MGCNGGMPGRALNFVQKQGITTQDKYSYVKNIFDSSDFPRKLLKEAALYQKANIKIKITRP